MVKKYRLTSENNSQKGGNFEIAYINQPPMAGLNTYNNPVQQPLKVDGMKLSPTAIISGDNVKVGIPLNGMSYGAPVMNYGMPGLNIPVNSNIATFTDGKNTTIIASPLRGGEKKNMDGGSGFGVAVLPSNGMTVTYQNNPIPLNDPSVFIATSSKSTEPKVMKPDSEIKVTYREPEIKRSIINMVPTLPGITPSNFNFNLPVGLVPTQPIVLNPVESQARIEITSPDSDDVITLSGEHKDMKPIYEKIVDKNKLISKAKMIAKEIKDEVAKGDAKDEAKITNKKKEIVDIYNKMDNKKGTPEDTYEIGSILNRDNNINIGFDLVVQNFMETDSVKGILEDLGFTSDKFKISKETRKDFMTMLGLNPNYYLERMAVGGPVITFHNP